jgi:hypothetical protein
VIAIKAQPREEAVVHQTIVRCEVHRSDAQFSHAKSIDCLPGYHSEKEENVVPSTHENSRIFWMRDAYASTGLELVNDASVRLVINMPNMEIGAIADCTRAEVHFPLSLNRMGKFEFKNSNESYDYLYFTRPNSTNDVNTYNTARKYMTSLPVDKRNFEFYVFCKWTAPTDAVLIKVD